MTKLFEKYAEKIRTSTLGEQDIITLRSHLNGIRRSSLTDDERSQLSELVYEHTPRIVAEQSQKGIDWLLDQWRTPTGRERKNNPFGSRELHVLENFSHFTLTGFYDTGRGFRPNYLPCYTVHATDGSAFEYVPYGSEWPTRKLVHIIG